MTCSASGEFTRYRIHIHQTRYSSPALRFDRPPSYNTPPRETLMPFLIRPYVASPCAAPVT